MVGQSLPQSPQLRLTIAPDAQHVDRGEQAVYLVTIDNRGSEAQAQTLEVRGLPPSWSKMDFDARRRAFPGEQRTATLIISLPDDAAPGLQHFEVWARAGTAESAVAASLELLAPGGLAQPPAPSTTSAPASPRTTSSAPAAASPPPPVAPEISLIPAAVLWRGEAQGEERLVLRVRNTGAEESEYAVTLDGLDSAWFAAPSRLRVGAGQTVEGEIRLHPPARARQGDYSFRVGVASSRMPEIRRETTGRLTVEVQERTPQVSRGVAPVGTEAEPRQAAAPQAPVLPPDVALGPRTSFRFGAGEIATQAVVTVQNRSRLIERYEISVSGIAEDWFGLSVSDLRLEPGASAQVPLRLSPRAGPTAPAGDYEFRVRVSPHSFPASFAEVGGIISITGTAAFDARLTPAQTTGRKEKFKLTLHNTGGLPLSLWMEGADPEGMCRFNFPPPPNLEPGQEAVVPIWVGTRRNGLWGDPRTLEFQLRVSPAGGLSTAAKSFNARFVHQPFLSHRFVYLSGVLLLVAIAIGVILSLGFASISHAVTAVACGYKDDYHQFKNGPDLIREKCGGAGTDRQKTLYLPVGTTPTGSVTPAAGASATPATSGTAAATGTAPANATAAGTATACAGNASYGLAVGKDVVLQSQALVREAPGGNITFRSAAIKGPIQITGGPRCEAGLVWWQIKFDNPTGTGWTAEFGGSIGGGPTLPQDQLICLAPNEVRPQGICN